MFRSYVLLCGVVLVVMVERGGAIYVAPANQALKELMMWMYPNIVIEYLSHNGRYCYV